MKKACVACGRSFTPKLKRQRRCESCEPLHRAAQARHGTSGGAWDTLRRHAHTRDGGRCVRCGVEVALRERDATDKKPLMHLAHRQAKEQGGADVLDNVETACKPCHDLETYG